MPREGSILKDIFENLNFFWLIRAHRIQRKEYKLNLRFCMLVDSSIIFDCRKFGDWFSLISGPNILWSTHHFLIFFCLNSYVICWTTSTGLLLYWKEWLFSLRLAIQLKADSSLKIRLLKGFLLNFSLNLWFLCFSL